MKYLRNILLLMLMSTLTSNAQEFNKGKSTWDKISPYFFPPDEFKNSFGDYRSPLKFYNGKNVLTPKDWKKRRAEILNRWNGLMGKWPELLKEQQLTYLDTLEKDGYTQFTVSFNWMPNEKTIGYLLVPNTKGKKPAVNC